MWYYTFGTITIIYIMGLKELTGKLRYVTGVTAAVHHNVLEQEWYEVGTTNTWWEKVPYEMNP